MTRWPRFFPRALRLLALVLLFAAADALVRWALAPPSVRADPVWQAGLTVKVTTSGSCPHAATLSWNPSPDGGAQNPAMGYYVYRGSAPGQEATTPVNLTMAALGCTAKGNCTYADTTVKGGVTYYYKIRAAVGPHFAQQSVMSNEAAASIPCS